MNKILKQIENHLVYSVVTRIHNKEDVEDGDLCERLDEYEYYNHLEGYLIDTMDLHAYEKDEDKVEYFAGLIKNNGILNMPKIVIDENGDVIDGFHRLCALHKLGYKTIDLLKGTNEKYTPIFKKELIDEDLKIYKIYNDFGSISIMEDAIYSPSDNSVCEFLVDKEYRGLGVGTELLKEAMKQYSNLGAQVSSEASLKVFLECGFTPNNLINKDVIHSDLSSYSFKTFNKCYKFIDTKISAYESDIKLFNLKFDETIKLFKENGGSLFLKYNRSLSLELKNKKNNTLKI